MLFWEMTTKECERNHLLRQFNKKYYEGTKTFQGKQIINAPIHLQDVQAKSDMNYNALILNFFSSDQQQLGITCCKL
jgi:hypothetical protein